MKRRVLERSAQRGLVLAFCLALALVACSADVTAPSAAAEAGRHVRFTYAATITELQPGATARIWIPLPAVDAHQQVEILDLALPGEHRETTDRRFGNRLFYMEAVAGPDGTIPLSVEYDITRRPITPGGGPLADETRAFLQPDRLVPTEGGEFDALLAGVSTAGSPTDVARRLFEVVDARMAYDKPAGGGWGRGDSVWACGAGYGNCTDFHSLFLSLARALQMPARFEMGFPLPAERGQGEVGGYHCWAWFLDGDCWAPVDISEADKHPERRLSYFAQLDADRIGFTVGRDLPLDPPAAAGPVNFLIYPYVEVDGQPHTSLEKHFTYEDV